MNDITPSQAMQLQFAISAEAATRAHQAQEIEERIVQLEDKAAVLADYLGLRGVRPGIERDEIQALTSSIQTTIANEIEAGAGQISAALAARSAAAAPAQAVAVPGKALPYEPTSDMLIAAREHDPALPIETIRAIYWSMWRTAPTAPAQEHATQLAGPALRTYIGHVQSVADLVNNLLLLDQTLPIYGAQYIEHPPGKRRAIAVPPTVSRERVKDSRWIGEGDTLNAAVIWTRAEQPAAPVQAQEDARDVEAEALRACSDLPEGWDIVIHLEKGSGSVVLIDPEFNESDMALDGSLFEALKQSIDQAAQVDAARAARGDRNA